MQNRAKIRAILFAHNEPPGRKLQYRGIYTPMVAYTVLSGFSAAVQAVAGILTIRRQYKVWLLTKEGSMPKSPSIPLAAWLLFAGCSFSAGAAIWVGYNPPKPQVLTVERVVEKVVPCPATSTGSATARAGNGGISNAHSGNGDTYNSQE